MRLYASSTTTPKDIIRAVADALREERTTATNIESAVDKAGADRDEVNATFGSMHVLILEMVFDLSAALIRPLEEGSKDRPVRDVLIEFGSRLAKTYSGSHLIALYRIALTEATRHSGIGRELFERGPGRLTMCLAQYLEQSALRFNQGPVDNSKRVAETFLSLLRENLALSNAVTTARISSPTDNSAAVIEAVELLCHGIVAESH